MNTTQIVWTYAAPEAAPQGWISLAQWVTQTFSYCMIDARGREIGGNATITLYEGDARPYRVQTWATRNGETFGAIPRGVYCLTLDEAKAQGARALAEQAKRYAKKYAK